MKKFLLILAISILIFSYAKPLFPAKNTGYILNINNAIGPVTYYQIKNIIKLAEQDNTNFVLLIIDTPGGLLSSTRKIVQEILESRVPVIAYVYPKGAQCASAGVFISLSCHIIGMSPATNIGAAHPVNLTGQSDEIITTKLVNDTVSFIKSIANHRNRNVKWAEKAVRESISSTEKEALREKVIDVIATDTAQLMTLLEGKIVKVNGKEVTLKTKNSNLVSHQESFKDNVLKTIADPNIASILLMIGFIGILMEFYNPGFGVPGIVGTISLILAFFALHALPINMTGLILIVLSLIFFAIEAVTASFGLFIISGIFTLTLGSFFLFKPMSDFGISYSFLFWLIMITSFIIFLSLFFMLKTKRRKITTGEEGLIGETGKTLSPLIPEGRVFVHGEYWTGISTEGDIPEGEKIKVIGIKNLKLIVKKGD